MTLGADVQYDPFPNWHDNSGGRSTWRSEPSRRERLRIDRTVREPRCGCVVPGILKRASPAEYLRGILRTIAALRCTRVQERGSTLRVSKSHLLRGILRRLL